MLRKTLAALLLCAAVLCTNLRAQDCAPPAIVANARADNMFTPEQEMVFGELTVQRLAGDIRFVRDERLTAYVTGIGERIIRHLPQIGLKFHFYLIDLPEANAFNIPGGHVFISRKIVSLAVNEDELAGVIAHELGHATVRHGAIDMSAALRKVLGVNSLGDRKDVTEKYNLLIERARTKRFSTSRGHEDAQQLEADKIGVFALAAAGYDPSAFYSLFGRLTEAKAKGGNWFSNIFSNPLPEEKRLREMTRATGQMPAACRDRRAEATDAFLKWQADVVSYREFGRKEELPGLVWKKELQPKLRSDVTHFAFSRDGRLLLAQDDFSVTVIERDPARVLFQIPVEDADEATFTPDGQHVVFTTENLRFEKWSVAEQKPVEVRELVLRADCWEHNLSPDGNYLACVDMQTNVNVLDVKTGKKVWEKKEFYQLDFFEFIAWLASAERGDENRLNFFRINFSPDSRYVVFSRSDLFRFRFRWDAMVVAESENTALTLDLPTLKTVGMGGDLKKLAARAYAFVDPESVVGMPSNNVNEAGVFSFPSGKRLRKFAFGARVVERTANPDYVIFKPTSTVKMGVFDIKRGTVVGGFDKEDGTFFGDLLAYESVNGKILLRQASYNESDKKFDLKDVANVEIPVGPIKSLGAADVSDDFGWLLLSSKTRGGLWNLSTGERKIYVRGFRGAVVANDGGAVGDFVKLGETPHSLVLMNGKTDAVVPIRDLPEYGARQHGRFVLLRSSLGESAGKDEKKNKLLTDVFRAGGISVGGGGGVGGGEESEGPNLRHDARFELKDIVSGKVIWTRDFQKDVPAYSFDEFSGRLIFFWRLGSDSGKARLKESAELKAKADALGNKADDYLVEVVDAFAQKTVGALTLETGMGSFRVSRGISEGDWLVLRDSAGRVLVYSIATGEVRHRFFGDTAAINPRRNQIVVENFPGEVELYDLDTGDRRATFRINGGAAFVRFNLEGNRLFVLSDSQAAYNFDLDKLSPAKVATANE
ncbi:MAG TPA: M48 family metalloprotease [Pyrinomonadaceae bacterium]|nr:M48 family metalloprotease [Pyrinomonadaceae bacterium]